MSWASRELYEHVPVGQIVRKNRLITSVFKIVGWKFAKLTLIMSLFLCTQIVASTD